MLMVKRIFLWVSLLLLPSVGFAVETIHHDIRFLALSDIHFDPFTACYSSKKPCTLIQALQQAPASQWARILSSYDVGAPKYRNDTNYPLLAYSLNKAKQAAVNNQVQFVLILGDFLGHEYRRYFKMYSSNYSRNNYHAFVKKTLEFLTIEIGKTFPHINVYMVEGNNDSYSANYGYYPRTGFYSNTGALWSGLIRNNEARMSMQRQFSIAGYYAVNLSPEWKLIVLNTVLFSTKGNGKGINEAALRELNWFQQELQSAKNNKQKVLIAMHIPPGIDVYATLKFRLFRMIELWKLPDTERYEALLKDYAPEIAGIFAGHLHHELLQQLAINNKNSVPMAGVTSISPIFGNNPGFSIYVFSNDGELETIKSKSFPLGSVLEAQPS